MVAIIKPGKSLRDTFYYNENKVKEGQATCLLAMNYPKETDSLNEYTRLHMLQKLAAQNTRTKVNSIHFTLNFAPSENHLSQDILKEIAKEYMEKVGFGNQPYLVYQHFDAGHPHLHILTTNIEADGQRIDLHHLGIRKSEPARKEIEQKYHLVKAEDQRQQPFELKPAHLQKVTYGRTESRRAIANILTHILPAYKYTSLPELNAVLNLYHVMADRGSERSRTYQNNGLLYRILDDNRKPIGVPIKASAIPQKPTLKYLEQQFVKNKPERDKHKARVKNAIDLLLRSQKTQTLDDLIAALKKEGIHTVTRRSKEGFLYGITYVDHRTKSVFNGSALGKPYSAKGILERCGQSEDPKQQEQQRKTMHPEPATGDKTTVPAKADEATHMDKTPDPTSLTEALLQSENAYVPVPYPLKKTRKRKRKRLSNNNQ